MNEVIFKGSCVALVTPFKNNAVDYEALEKIINYQIENGTAAILVLGTTGEPPTLTVEEKHEIIKFANKVINKRVKMIVGTGGNNTQKVVEDSKFAIENGADALLVVTPYYNKCTQNGLIAHYNYITEKLKFPIIVYNVPGRTGVNIQVKTAKILAENPYICGIKEASGNIDQITELCATLNDKFAIYSGDDALNYTFMTLGAMGGISVTANVYPKQVANVIDYCLKGEWENARKLHEKLLPVNKAMFIEVNPIPVKAAMEIEGLCEGKLRLPLTTIEEENKIKLTNILNEFKN